MNHQTKEKTKEKLSRYEREELSCIMDEARPHVNKIYQDTEEGQHNFMLDIVVGVYLVMKKRLNK